MNMALTFLGPILEKIIEELLKPENIQTYGDKLFDVFEDVVTDSKNTIDDKIVLPILKMLRAGMNIPDND
jgi:hypothetical protein